MSTISAILSAGEMLDALYRTGLVMVEDRGDVGSGAGDIGGGEEPGARS